MAIALLRTGLNPFDQRTLLFAKHAQHVVLIHFPIALFIGAVAFRPYSALDEVRWPGGRCLLQSAKWQRFRTLPVLATGILAWQFQLEGQKLKGILLLHLILACVSSVMIWLVWWVNFRARRRVEALPSYRLAIEFLAVAAVVLTAHLGGFLSGVNGPG
jgi:uncharacterized membrane protein